jgi:hypothetical protein
VKSPRPRRRSSCRWAGRARFFTTIATLGTPLDVTLQELRVESFFPADDAIEQLTRRLAGAG